MAPESTSIIYDLGAHALEITQEHTALIAVHSTGNGPLSELVQLDSDETYRLFIALKEQFQ